MTGKTHAGIGIIAYVALYNKIPNGFSYMGILISVLASLLPDIDHPKSMINKYILPFKNKATKFTVYFCIGILFLWFDYLYVKEPLLKALGCVFIVIAISSHRNGLTHSLSGFIIFSCIAGYIGRMYQIVHVPYDFMIGYGMHLLGDMSTSRGIPLFYPFRNKKYKLPFTYAVGSKTGEFIEGVLIIGGFIYILYKMQFTI